MNTIRASLLLLSLAVAISAGLSAKEACSFQYSDVIRDKIAIPLVSKGLGDQAMYYDYEKPATNRVGDVVSLLFRFDDRKLGPNAIAIDTPYWKIELNACTLEVVGSYEVTGPGLSPKGGLIVPVKRRKVFP